MSDCSDNGDARYGRRDDHPGKRKSRRFSRSRSPICRRDKHGDNKESAPAAPVVDKKQKKIVEFFTVKSTKKKKPSDNNSKNSPNESKGHKRKLGNTSSPVLPKRAKTASDSTSLSSTPSTTGVPWFDSMCLEIAMMILALS